MLCYKYIEKVHMYVILVHLAFFVLFNTNFVEIGLRMSRYNYNKKINNYVLYFHNKSNHSGKRSPAENGGIKIIGNRPALNKFLHQFVSTLFSICRSVLFEVKYITCIFFFSNYSYCKF